jgi:hypothetical protein
MSSKGGARCAAFLAPHLGAIGIVNALRLARQQLDFLAGEQLRQKQPALAIEVIDLLLGQLHDAISLWFPGLGFTGSLRVPSSRISRRLF